jgi:type II secretory pathway pseudopilin PulG
MINRNIKYAYRLRGGFTLIETLIAVLLLVTAIAGPLTLAAKALSGALIARDEMVAFYLAQDAIEYVRYVRDSNKLATPPNSWLTGLSDCTGAAGCAVDPTSGAVTACSGTCPYLKKHDDGSGAKYFSYTLGSVTPQRFLRTITLASPASGATTEEILTVSVSWRAQSGVTRTIVVRENLFDWQ